MPPGQARGSKSLLARIATNCQLEPKTPSKDQALGLGLFALN